MGKRRQSGLRSGAGVQCGRNGLKHIAERKEEVKDMANESIYSAGSYFAVLSADNFGLRWNWFNWFNLIILVLMLLPNLVYAWKCGGEADACGNKWINLFEQMGRYGTMFFMVVCIGESDFGFRSVYAFLCYWFGCSALLLAYWVAWAAYFRVSGVRLFARREAAAVFAAGERQVKRATALKWALVILPSCLFLLCGITLMYIPLIIFAVCFAVGHVCVTWVGLKKAIVRLAG